MRAEEPTAQRTNEAKNRSDAAIGWGIAVPTFGSLASSWDDCRAVAREAEDLGFDTVWVGDHLACPTPNLEAVTSLAYLASATHSIRLGLGVLIPALREPAWVVKQLQTLDVISEGRLTLGLGIGGEFPKEWQAVGIPASERGRRTDELLAVLPELLRGHESTLSGAINRTVPSLLPAMTQERLPIWIGGRSPAALRRAARFGDGWLGIWVDPPRVCSIRETLRELAAECNRAIPRIGIGLIVSVDRNRIRAQENLDQFLRAQYGLSLSKVSRYTAAGTAKEVQSRLAEFEGAGVEGFEFTIVGPDLKKQLVELAAIRDSLHCKASN